MAAANFKAMSLSRLLLALTLPDDAPGIFSQEFEGLMSLVAQNVSVEIRPTDQWRSSAS